MTEELQFIQDQLREYKSKLNELLYKNNYSNPSIEYIQKWSMKVDFVKEQIEYYERLLG